MHEITEEEINALETELDGISFDASRREVLRDNASFDVQACPGSGKTTLLAAKLLILSKKWTYPNKGICVLSHTNVAKNEIINLLKHHSTGWRFLEYPHFIGTIQEFVNKFLAIPYIRNEKIPLKAIDDDVYLNKCSSLLKYGTKAFLSRKYCSLSELSTEWDDNGGIIVYNIPGFSGKSNSDSYKNLVGAKKKLISSGYFQYKEMYAYAEANLHYNSFLMEILRNRFKMVFIDEMQDTQKHQDDLIEKIFPRYSQKTFIQRFGDTDQGIFDGMSEEPNQSFNGENCKYRINDSHRFTPCIANLAKGLSSSKLDLQSVHPCENNYKHEECKNWGKNVIFVYDSDETAKQIPQLYADHVAEIFSDKENKADLNVMAIGAIGKKSEEGFHVRIDTFFKDYTKSKKAAAPIFENLYECVAFTRQNEFQNIKDSYELIANSLLRHLYTCNVNVILDGKEQPLNKSHFFSVLKQDKENFKSFNTVIGNWAFDKALPTQKDWKTSINTIIEVLNEELTNIPSKFSSHEFLAYPTDDKLKKYRKPENFNVVLQDEGISVLFDTIHGVKGQTHDATLVLETKYSRSMDIKTLIKNISDPNVKLKNGIQNKKFMKQLYVAMSRPKSILCLAVHKDSINGHETALKKNGWKIENVMG